MNDDSIIAAAESADMAFSDCGKVFAWWQEDTDLPPYLRQFADLLIATERERCAKVCEAIGVGDSAEEMALICARAIRTGV